MVVFDDALLAATLPLLTAGVTTSGGQFCMAGSRILVQRGIADQVREHLAERLSHVVAVARAVLSPAPRLLLDEPTAHLDRPAARRLLRRLAEDPRSVVLVTHAADLLDPRWRIETLQHRTG
jgi:ABC-type transport system involved in cytochrome bd biosynthesis fused ATPase/permease subunit